MSAIATAIIGSAVVGGYVADRASDRASDAAAASTEAASDAASREIELGNRQAAIGERQVKIAEDQWATQKGIFDEFNPLLKEQITLSIDEQKKSIERGDDQWSFYKNTWRPLEQTLASRTAELTAPGRVEQSAQRAADDAKGQFETARMLNRRAAIASGASPEKLAAMEASARLAEAKGVGGVMGDARRATETQQMALLDNASRFGRNMPSTGIAVAGLAGAQGAAASGGVAGLQQAAAAPATYSTPVLNAAGANFGGAAGSVHNAGTLFRGVGLDQFGQEAFGINQGMGLAMAGANIYGRYFYNPSGTGGTKP